MRFRLPLTLPARKYSDYSGFVKRPRPPHRRGPSGDTQDAAPQTVHSPSPPSPLPLPSRPPAPQYPLARSPPPPPAAAPATVADMHTLVARHTTALPVHVPYSGGPRGRGGEVVLVTGTSGALGANILAQLLVDPDVAVVYALNRPHQADASVLAYEKQVKALAERGLDPELVHSEKLILLEADTTAAGLGIETERLEEIKDAVTLIIHNAWPVHFVRDLSSFEPVFRGLRNLVDIALHSPQERPPRLLFVSSAGVLTDHESPPPLPETAVEAHAAAGMGYTASKWVAERILEICAETTPLQPIIVRVGQLCGGINGAWNTREWLPALARAGQVLGTLPMRDDRIGWLPVHNAATAIIEAWHSPERYLTLVHPRPVPWATVFEPLAASVNATLIPLPEWVAKLERDGSRAHDARLNPALRLLDFYQTSNAAGLGISNFSTANAQKVSNTLASLRPLVPGDVAKWVAYWRKVRFLEEVAPGMRSGFPR